MADVVLDRAVVELAANTEGLRRDLQRASREVQRVGSEIQFVGRSMTAALTLPLAGIGVAVFKAAADSETALTGVAKTVDAPADAIQRLGERFKDLSETIPVSADELAKVAALGGQLGIQVQNLEGFVKTMVALGVSTNLSAEEAGSALARLSNIMGTSQTDFDRLGSVVVDLGNNLATTEREIVAFSTRMAGAGKIAGLTEADVLAIGGAMSSVGIEAEAGGTAVQKVLIDINTAVAQSNDQLKVFADVAGKTASDFAALWQRDAGAAFVAFVEGLGRSGDDAVTVLSELGLENQRLVRSFLSLANAGPLLAEAIDRASKAWKENTALTTEAERFYNRMAARLAEVKNEAVNVAAELSTALAPGFEALIKAIRGVLNIVRDLAAAFAALPEWIRTTTAVLATFAAAAGPVAIVVGTLVQAVGVLLGLRVASAIVGWTRAFASLAIEVRSVSAAIALLEAALGPAGWILLGLGALGGALVLAARHMGQLKRRTDALKKSLDEAAGSMKDLGRNATEATIANIEQAIFQATQRLQEFGQQAKEASAQGGVFRTSDADLKRQAELKVNVDQAKAEIADLSKLLAAARARLNELNDPSLATLRQELQRASGEVERLKGLVADAKSTVDTLKNASPGSALSADLPAAQERLSALEGLLKEAEANLVAVREQAKQLGVDLTDAADSGTRALKTLEERIKAIRDLGSQADLFARAVESVFDPTTVKDYDQAITQLRASQRALLAIEKSGKSTLEEQVEAAEARKAVEAEINDLLRKRQTIQDIQNFTGRGLGNIPGADPLNQFTRNVLNVQQGGSAGTIDVQKIGADQVNEVIRSVTRHLAELRVQAENAASAEEQLAAQHEAERQAAVALVAGLVSVADGLGLLEGKARNAVRGVSDVLNSLQALQGAGDLKGFAKIGAVVGGFGGLIGGVAGVINGLLNSGEEAKEAERRFRASLREWDRALQDFTSLFTDQSRLDQMLKEARDFANRLFQQLKEAFRGTVPGRAEVTFADTLPDLKTIRDLIADITQQLKEDPSSKALQYLLAFWKRAEELAEDAAAAAERAAEQAAREEAAYVKNLAVQTLYAKGLDEVAAKMKLRIDEELAIADAIAKGLSDKTVQAIKEYYAAVRESAKAAREAAEAEKAKQDARTATDFLSNIDVLEAQNAGDAVGAFIAQTMADVQRQINNAQDLLDEGIIDQAAFDRFVKAIRENASQAIQEFIDQTNAAADAARQAAEAERFRAMIDTQNLRVQLLQLQGRSREALVLQNQIDLLKAIEDGRSAEYIALLKQIGAEKLRQQAMQDATKAQDDLNRSIAQTTTALNAPAGLRLSLLRWRSLIADQVPTQDIQQTAQGARQFSNVQMMPPERFIQQPDPSLREPAALQGSGLSPRDYSRAPATQPTAQAGDSYVDQSVHIDRVTIQSAGPSETGDELLRKIRQAGTATVRRGGADPFRRVRP